jgi:prohibitin 1
VKYALAEQIVSCGAECVGRNGAERTQWRTKMSDSDEQIIKTGFFGILKLIVSALVVLFILACISGIFVSVPAGNVGVADTFGQVDPVPWQPGLHIKAPWTSIVMFSTQTQKYYDSGSPGDSDVAQIQALSNEGLSITMEIAVNYHLVPEDAPSLYKTVGTSYQTVVMKPPIHSVPRDIISKYDAMTLYSASSSNNTEGRVQIEQQLYDGISKGILKEDGSSRGIVIESVFLRNVILPKSITDAIEAKQSMQQQIQEKSFEVEKQRMEADRMREEAKGISDANKIIANSLTSSYLEWYTIEMMKNHQGATYFIPVGTDGRAHPEIVLPVNATSSV